MQTVLGFGSGRLVNESAIKFINGRIIDGWTPNTAESDAICFDIAKTLSDRRTTPKQANRIIAIFRQLVQLAEDPSGPLNALLETLDDAARQRVMGMMQE